MPRHCGPCSDKRRTELDRRLLQKNLTGEPFRRIAKDFGYSETALRRHKESHVKADLVDVRQVMVEARDQALAEARVEVLQAIKADEVEAVKAEVKEGMAARLETCTTFLDQLQAVRDRAANLLDQAEASQDMRAAGTFLKELREQIRLMAELEGKISNQPQVNILIDPQWVELRTSIITALDGYPEAREAVVHAIRGR